MKVEMLEKVFENLNVEKYVEMIEEKLNVEYDCVESIYSNLYVFELLVEYLNEGSLMNIEKISSYWFKKSNEYLKKNGINVFEDFEIIY